MVAVSMVNTDASLYDHFQPFTVMHLICSAVELIPHLPVFLVHPLSALLS